jgi:hypothetical protein
MCSMLMRSSEFCVRCWDNSLNVSASFGIMIADYLRHAPLQIEYMLTGPVDTTDIRPLRMVCSAATMSTSPTDYRRNWDLHVTSSCQ